MSRNCCYFAAIAAGFLLAACSSTAEESAASRPESDPPVQSPPSMGGSSAPHSESTPSGSPPELAGEIASWQVYRNEDYGLELRYPEKYVLQQPGGEPQPRPALRLWFGEEIAADSPVAGRVPPLFAVDVYDNPEQQDLRDWLEATGVRVQPGRRTLTPHEVASREGLVLALSAQLAPNTFYYVAAGPYVYRFTPLGPDGGEILETVNLLWDD